jgi:integrase
MLRVSDSGHKSYALLARYQGAKNPTRRMLGPVFDGFRPPGDDPGIYDRHGAALTLAEAREKARRWLDLIARKIDPAAERKEQAEVASNQAQTAARAAHSTFGAVAEEWVRRHGNDLAKALEAERLVRREFIARWGDRPIAAITPKDVAAAIRAIVDRGARYQAFGAYGYLRQIFNFALGSGEFEITASPLAALRQKALIGDKLARDRVLDNDELTAVWRAAITMGYPFGTVVQLLILTGQRLREIADLSWPEVDLEERLITIPAKRMKGGKAHEVPLAPLALVLIEELPQWPDGRFLFSTTDGRHSVGGFGRPKRRLDELSGIGGFVLHDVRRTMRTRLSALAIEDRVREAVIAHAQPSMHQVYNQHSYRPEKRDALEKWEARLSTIVTPERKVVALRGPRP